MTVSIRTNNTEKKTRFSQFNPRPFIEQAKLGRHKGWISWLQYMKWIYMLRLTFHWCCPRCSSPPWSRRTRLFWLFRTCRGRQKKLASHACRALCCLPFAGWQGMQWMCSGRTLQTSALCGLLRTHHRFQVMHDMEYNMQEKDILCWMIQ